MGGAYPDDGGTIVDKELMEDLDEDGNPEGHWRIPYMRRYQQPSIFLFC